jgi:hypothetical protein
VYRKPLSLEVECEPKPVVGLVFGWKVSVLVPAPTLVKS